MQRFIPFQWVYGMLFTAAHKARRHDFLLELWEGKWLMIQALSETTWWGSIVLSSFSLCPDMVRFGVEMKKVEAVERFCAGLWDFQASAEVWLCVRGF